LESTCATQKIDSIAEIRIMKAVFEKTAAG